MLCLESDGATLPVLEFQLFVLILPLGAVRTLPSMSTPVAPSAPDISLFLSSWCFSLLGLLHPTQLQSSVSFPPPLCLACWLGAAHLSGTQSPTRPPIGTWGLIVSIWYRCSCTPSWTLSCVTLFKMQLGSYILDLCIVCNLCPLGCGRLQPLWIWCLGPGLV